MVWKSKQKMSVIQKAGRIVAADDYRLNPNNIKAVKDLVRKKPKTLGDVRSLLGMIGYFRKYIANFNWAVCNQFRDYLYYVPHFDIWTDNNPVTYIMSVRRSTSTGQRWVNELAESSFSLHYKPGKQNNIANTLSCTSEQTHSEHMQSCTEIVSLEMVKALSNRSDLTPKNPRNSSSLSQRSYQGTDKYLRWLNISK